MMLTVQDFKTFFEEVHGLTPFPWQQRLIERVARHGEWPATLNLPTGAGKTAAIDVAIFHLALEVDHGSERHAPVRIAFVVDRRLVVDDAYARAHKLAASLLNPPEGSVTAKVAEALKSLSLDGPPLIARRLRGGIPREDDWARTPSQPTVLCSTVDQVGSRLLFRGYGVSDSMKPVHAGLIGSDCLILLDEAHLAEPFRQTLDWAKRYRGENWRASKYVGPWGMTLLTATPGAEEENDFELDKNDRANPILKRRLDTGKPVRLVQEEAEENRQRTFVKEARQTLNNGSQAVGVVVNRVARARDLFETLRKELGPESTDLLLLIGPSRPAQRDQIASLLNPIRTGAARKLDKPLVIVATQCIEAGVDIDLDALFTELAPLDCLKQRFGRLNRDGRDLTSHAAIVAVKEEIGARADDPIYGKALSGTWKALNKGASKRNPIVDFGLRHFNIPMSADTLSPKQDAPVLMPAHLDLLSQTSPIPTANPEVALYLHGPSRQPDAVTIIWRADIDPAWNNQDVVRLLTLVPPRTSEAVELPVWAVSRWLSKLAEGTDVLADVSTSAPKDSGRNGKDRVAFRWKGVDERSRWVKPRTLRPGDTVVVPVSYGGVDDYGWNPKSHETAVDLADMAAEAYRGRRFAVRIAPGLLGDAVSLDTLSSTLAGVRQENLPVVRDVLFNLPLPEERKQLLSLLSQASGRRGRSAVEMHFDLHGTNVDDEPRGVVFIAPFGIEGGAITEEGRPNSTEDDASGSLYGFAQTLREHSEEVEAKAETFARAAGLPEDRITDLKLAGFLHDQGKRDVRFQRWLHYGDPLGADPDDERAILAKSGRALPPHARDKAGLPSRWRHEALSVRLARAHERVNAAKDRDLVLWLVGTHHGYGRPLFPHADSTESPPDVGPQSLAFDWNGMDWATLFQMLKTRYGVWELARMEAILRLADHRASEEAAKRGDGT